MGENDTNPDWVSEQVSRVARAVRELRGDKSAQWVSDVTAELGHRVTRAIIADLETGRRKYVSTHELSMLAAALGATPATLLTWGLVPDGRVEVLPGREVAGMDAANWWGGQPLNRFESSGFGLPKDHPNSTELFFTCRQRERLNTAYFHSMTGGIGQYPDPGFVSVLTDRLSGIVQRIKELGGVVVEKAKG